MNTKNQMKENNSGGWSRWMRVGLLTFTMAGPAINSLLQQMRNRSQMAHEQAEELSSTSVQRLNELNLSTRQRASVQAQLLRKQAQQLQTQAQQLQKALRDEAKQRQKVRKLQKQLRKSRIALSKDLLKRGELLTGDVIEQGSKLSHQLVERSSKATKTLTRRGSQATQELVKRGSKTSQALLERTGEVSQDLLERSGKLSQNVLERGSKFSQNVAERSGQLLEPVRKRNSRFWTVVGFTTGLVAAGIVTYVLVRRRMANAIDADIDEQVELPYNSRLNGASVTRPAGEIHHVSNEGASVATLASTKVESVPEETVTEKIPVVQTMQEEQAIEAPAYTAFVGIVSTKHYYPVNAAPEATDIIYFSTEDEAQADGFTPAPTE